jgi:predicted RNase H-like HicB family nuclease
LRYIAYIRKDDDSDYGIEFPDFPGCVSAGKSLEEAHAMGAEALAAYVEYLMEEGKPVPRASSLDDLKNDRHRKDAVVSFIELDETLFKPERVNVMIPKGLLARIDAVSDGNRSRFLVEAAEERLTENRLSEGKAAKYRAPRRK